jgi:hypothetical protein
LLTQEQLEEIVQRALDQFYNRRLASFENLDLKTVLKGKNPYLFRAMGIKEPKKLVDSILAAYLSSSDEGKFGDAFFEPVAMEVSGGRKSLTDSVDIEIDIGANTRAYAVKSGLSVFNGQSRKRQIQSFEECRRRLPGRAFEAIVGYGYGNRESPPRGSKNFREVSGQAFWEELSGDPELYKKLLAIVGKKADEHAIAYEKAFAAVAEKFMNEFQADFAMPDGQIDWEKLLTFNSAKKAPKQPKAKKIK